MQGFIDRRINLFLRRAITMAPALVVLAIGLDPSKTLVTSLSRSCCRSASRSRWCR